MPGARGGVPTAGRADTFWYRKRRARRSRPTTRSLKEGRNTDGYLARHLSEFGDDNVWPHPTLLLFCPPRRCGLYCRAVIQGLFNEIADALRAELREGRWRDGETLPSIAALRARFAAGEFAVRHALHVLRNEGLVTLKQGIGAVAAIPDLTWKGRLAYIAFGTTGSYFTNRLAAVLAHRLGVAGWELTPIFLGAARDGALDITPIRRTASGGLALAILNVVERQVSDVCDALHVPYIALRGYPRDYPNAVATICEDVRSAYAALVETLRARSVRAIAEFDTERKVDRSFKGQLFESGIDVRRVFLDGDAVIGWSLEEVRRRGHAAVARWLRENPDPAHRPDVVMFDDDYLASGGIAALLEAGLRIPRDIRVVTRSNAGNAPVLGVSLARIENDPVAYGETVARYALQLLGGERPPPPRIEWRFIPGESL